MVESGTLAIEPVAACVALPGPERTVLELDVTVGDGARLVLEDAPLVVAEGADVVRTTTIRLGTGATAVVRDLVVLGRAGEGRGRLESLLRVEGPDGPILHDALRIEPGARDEYVALAPGDRAVGTVAWLGEGAGGRGGAASADGGGGRGGAGGARVAGGALARGGALWRAAGASAADVEAALGSARAFQAAFGTES